MHDIIKWALIGLAAFAVCYIAFGLFLWVLHSILGVLQPIIKFVFLVGLVLGAIWFIGDPNGFLQSLTIGFDNVKAIL